MMGDDGFRWEARSYIKEKDHPVSMSFTFSSRLHLDILYIRREQRGNDLQAVRHAQRFLFLPANGQLPHEKRHHVAIEYEHLPSGG
jgi:hypothetical protein